MRLPMRGLIGARVAVVISEQPEAAFSLSALVRIARWSGIFWPNVALAAGNSCDCFFKIFGLNC
jgi:hypothetical protein